MRESYRLLNSLLTEGMDIHAFRKTFEGPDFQRDCDIFAARIQADAEAREYARLKNLNDYKGKPIEFHEAIENALDFIYRRKYQKNLRKAEKMEGVDIVFQNDKCLITSPKSPEYARAAGGLLKGEKTCPWCIALNYPENLKHWEEYGVCKAFFLYSKEDGVLKDAWAMTLTEKDCWETVNKGAFAFSQLEDLKNSGRGGETMRYVRFMNFYLATEISGGMISDILREYL